MNTNVDALLDDELNNGETTLTVDEQTRAIKYEGSLLLGIEDDYQADRIYFRIPKIVGDNIDVSADTAQIYVDFKNAYNEPYIYECTDKAVQDDGSVKFSWLLTEKVTAAKGKVEFRVCVKNSVDGLIHNEWHTAIFTGEVLKGIDVSSKTPEILADKTASTYLLIQKIDEWEAKLDETITNLSGYTKDELDDKLANTVDLTNEQEITGKKKFKAGIVVDGKIVAPDAGCYLEVNTADGRIYYASIDDIESGVKHEIAVVDKTVDLTNEQEITGYKKFNTVKIVRLYLEGGSNHSIYCDGTIEASKGYFVTDYDNNYMILAGGGVKALPKTPTTTQLFSGSTIVYDPASESLAVGSHIRKTFFYPTSAKAGDKVRIYLDGGSNYPTCQSGVIECELIEAGTAFSGRGCFVSALGGQVLLIGAEIGVYDSTEIRVNIVIHALSTLTGISQAAVYLKKVELVQ